MSTLRELFVSINFKGDAAKKIEAVDKSADKASESLGEMDGAVKKSSTSLGEMSRAAASAGAGLAKMAATAGAAVLAAGTAVVAATASWASHAQELGRTSTQYGLSVESLQELTYAAEAMGGEGDAVIEVIKEMAIRLNEFELTGAGPASDAIKTLGLNIKDLQGLKPDKQFEILAQKISEVSDAGQRIFLKDSLFGEEGGIKIGTLMEQGADGIRALREEARALGGVIGGEAVEKAGKFNREMLRLKTLTLGLRNDIASALLPVISNIVKKLAEWAQANRELIVERVTNGLRKFVEYAEKLLPILTDAIDLTVKLVDSVGGIDKALQLAVGGWLAFKVAGLAAVGAISKELLALSAGFTVGYALAEDISGAPEKRAKTAATARANKAASRAAELARAGVSLPDVEELVNAQNQLIQQENDALAVSGGINAISSEIERRLAEYDQLAPTMGPEAPGAPQGKARGLKSIKPGEKPVTLQSLLDEERKAGKDREKLRAIRAQAEAMRVNTEGEDRLALDRVIGGINSKLGQGAYKNINELLADAIGQDTGLAGAQLKPAGLGTTINNIDASITVNMGGIEVELPASIANARNPVAAGQEAGAAVLSEVRGWIEKAFRDQRSQIIG